MEFCHCAIVFSPHFLYDGHMRKRGKYTMRKQGKRCCAVVLLAALLLQMSACGERSSKTSQTDFVLDTVCTVTIYGGRRAENKKLLDACFALCGNYEELLSTTRRESEIYKLNHRETARVSEETASLLQKGLDYGALSGGGFDITIEPLSTLWNFDAAEPKVPAASDISRAAAAVDYRKIVLSGNTVRFARPDTQIDLGGIAKGYIADQLAAYLRKNGCEHALIDLGGNVLCVGGKTDGTDFAVGIQKPFSDEAITTVRVKDLSVVTSGVYERCFSENGRLYHHILNPKTGYPVENGLLSVTIVGPNSCDCDALSTACFALGLEGGLALLKKQSGYYGIFITDDYTLHFSEGAQAALKVRP